MTATQLERAIHILWWLFLASVVSCVVEGRYGHWLVAALNLGTSIYIFHVLRKLSRMRIDAPTPPAELVHRRRHRHPDD